VPVDRQHVYAAGRSMGGYRGQDLAPLHSNYFAAAAILGMGISEAYYSIVTRAERRTPAAIYIGDGEQTVLYDKAQNSQPAAKRKSHCPP
jgi:poly(3-hydroxybutyrate) depolymerase